ncbi:MAG: metal-dependent hydrolase, partial [Pseudomonadota bacterium]
MPQNQVGDIKQWVAKLSSADIPVLKQTARELEALRTDRNEISARGVADAIAGDPMITVKLLRYLQQHKRSSQTSEVVQVEQALI